MPAPVLYRCVKVDARRVRAETHVSRKLQPGLGVGWPRQGNFAPLPLRKDLKLKRTIIQQVGIACPVLLVLASLREDPQFVAAIVKPFAVGGGKVFPSITGIHKQKRMAIEDDLHQPAAVLRHKNYFYPWIGNLLRLPTHIIRLLNMATGACRHPGLLLRENAEVNKCCRIQCKYRHQTPKDLCFFHWRSLFRLIPFLAPEWILPPARSAHNRLLPLRLPPALSPLVRAPCNQFVLNRNKLLLV